MSIIHDLSNEQYHSTAGISSSAIKTVFKKSVAHWKGQKITKTLAFEMGSAVHALLLEESRDLVVKGPKTRVSKAFKELESKLTPDQVILREVEYNVAQCMVRSVLNNPVCKAALRHKDRLNEVSLFADCPRTGLALRARPDLAILTEGTLYDVKTTQDCTPKGFASETYRYAYHIQAAAYIYIAQLCGWDVTSFKFICVEKAAPYASHMFEVSPELLAKATEQMHHTLDIIAAAQKSGNYGTGWGDCTTLELPLWL